MADDKPRKVSLNLDQISNQEIEATRALLYRSRTEIIRSAVQFYCPLVREQKNGNHITITVTDPNGNKVHEYQVKFL